VCRLELTLHLVQSFFSPRNDDEIVAIRRETIGIGPADAG
jgi:hypothetical protein